MYWAANALRGFKRLYPACRRHVDLAALYYRNWARTLVRARACPLWPDLVRGMVAAALLDKRPRLGVLFLFAFLGLFRVSEALHVTYASLQSVDANLLHVFLPDSKRAQLKGAPEVVQIRDTNVKSVLAAWVRRATSSDLISPLTLQGM